MKPLKLTLSICALFFINVLTAQTTVEKLSGSALQSAISENLKKEKKEYDDIFGAYVVSTNDVALTEVQKNEILGKLKMLRSVFDCEYNTETNTLIVKNKAQESKVEIEQIKGVIAPYNMQINKYEQYLYRNKK